MVSQLQADTYVQDLPPTIHGNPNTSKLVQQKTRQPRNIGTWREANGKIIFTATVATGTSSFDG